MKWNKDTLREARLKLKLSQTALADELGVHFRTVQNWEKGTTSIPSTVHLALEKLFCEKDQNEYVPREEYNRVLAALDSATELNKKLSDLLQSNIKHQNK